MTTLRRAVLSCLACMPLLAACDRQPADRTAAPAAADTASAPATPSASATPAAPADTVLAREAATVAAKVRVEMAAKNIGLSDNHSQPKAEITPKGDLLIGGKPIIIDAAQRALLLQYRGQIIDIAAAGSAIGVHGADIGVKAARDAVKGIFGGNTDDLQNRVEHESRSLKAEAMKLCDRLPAMRATQDALSASLPAFKPYASMDQSDEDDCRKVGK